MIPLIIISTIEAITITVLWAIIGDLRRTIRQDHKVFEFIKTALNDAGKNTEILKKENRTLKIGIKPLKEALAEATNGRNELDTILKGVKASLKTSKRKDKTIKDALTLIEDYEKRGTTDGNKGMDI